MMIDYSISDHKNKFELIWSCIFKVMIFTIYRNFLEFFWNYLSIFSILNLIKSIKKGQKGVIYRAGPARMRRGMHGHVAEPRGPSRAPAWHGGATCAIYIFIYIIYGYSTYKNSVYWNSLTHKTVAPYKPDIAL